MNDHRHISAEGVNLITTFEGCSLRPYRDSVGVWTIGYGHTGGVSAKTPPLRDMMHARALLREDLVHYENSVKRLVSVPLSQRQFDALVSFAYNLGAGALAASTLLRQLNQRHYARAANHFTDWDRAGGHVLAGLLRRREAERKLFLRGSNRGTRIVALTGVR